MLDFSSSRSAGQTVRTVTDMQQSPPLYHTNWPCLRCSVVLAHRRVNRLAAPLATMALQIALDILGVFAYYISHLLPAPISPVHSLQTDLRPITRIIHVTSSAHATSRVLSL